jgi:hypothetical protein
MCPSEGGKYGRYWVQPATAQKATAANRNLRSVADFSPVKPLKAGATAQKATQVVNFRCITMSPPLLARCRQCQDRRWSRISRGLLVLPDFRTYRLHGAQERPVCFQRRRELVERILRRAAIVEIAV